MIHAQNLVFSAAMVRLIAEIDEFKGAWQALGNLAPDKLLQLRKVATIESIGASTRIEGSKLSDKQVGQLLSGLQIQSFDTRDEQEVVGYAELMNTVFSSYGDIPLTENFIQQLHGILLKHSDKDQWHRGRYKQHPNHVVATDAQGQQIGVVFETTSPLETPARMQELVKWTQTAFAEADLHPLLIIAIFIVCFLAIHPFQDGNGRLSRALTTYLLLKSGYLFVPYSSLEAVIEQEKKGYYLSLRQTQTTLSFPQPNWEAWIVFFLKSLKRQKDTLNAKISREQILLTQQNQTAHFILDILKERGRTTMGELEKLTSHPRSSLRRQVEKLIRDQLIRLNGKGKGAWYTLY